MNKNKHIIPEKAIPTNGSIIGPQDKNIFITFSFLKT